MSLVTTLDLRTVPGTVAECDIHEAAARGRLDPPTGNAHTLPEGTRLLDYEIVGPLGEGGFGIVYLAWDHAAEQHVAIKEYLPAMLASRGSVSPAVVVRSQRHSGTFRNGMRGFVNEAAMLARFDHPSLVKVLRFWEGNGTAYMAMPYYAGPTLARALADLGRAPSEAELLGWLRPLLDALGTMHAENCFHRDIAPDNILLTDEGPVLLDFGAARRVIDGAGPSPTVVLKPGFAPIEQYGDVATMKQGAWTDVYALASVVYAAVAGKPPTPSIQRLMDDRLQPLSELARGRYGKTFLAAIDSALSLHPSNRPQSAAEFWAQLSGEADELLPEEPAPQRAPAPPLELDALQMDVRDRVMPPMEAPAPPRGKRMKVAALATVFLLGGLVVGAYNRIGDPVLLTPPLPPPAISSAVPVPAPEPAPAPAPAPAPIAALPALPAVSALSLPTLPAREVQPVVPDVDPLPLPPPLPSPSAAEAIVAPAPEARPEPATTAAAEPVRKNVARASAEPARATRREARSPASEPAPRPALADAEAKAAQASGIGIGTGTGTGKCTDILQRASLGPLSSAEAALLRKGCE